MSSLLATGLPWLMLTCACIVNKKKKLLLITHFTQHIGHQILVLSTRGRRVKVAHVHFQVSTAFKYRVTQIARQSMYWHIAYVSSMCEECIMPDKSVMTPFARMCLCPM